jgi:hypothetical protein
MLRYNTLQQPEFVPAVAFRKGDAVFLARGTYQGTIGTYLNTREDDPRWADITEQDSQIRSHPIEWLEPLRP